MTEKTCNSCIHFGACSKWTDFPKQCGVPVCARFAQQSEWISVEDRLPQVIGKYICCVKNKDGNTWTITADYSPEMKTWFGQFGEVRNTVTHWMPLPEAPKP